MQSKKESVWLFRFKLLLMTIVLLEAIISNDLTNEERVKILEFINQLEVVTEQVSYG